MVRGHIVLKDIGYVIESFEMDGEEHLLHRHTIEPFAQVFRTQGIQQQEQLTTYSSRVFGPWTGGMGRLFIPANRANEPIEYTRFHGSTTVDTRWESGARLPILEENSTDSDLEVIRASVSFKDNLWGIWEDDTGTELVARKYTGSSTSWTGGGDVHSGASLAVDATSNGTGGSTASLTVSHTCSGTNRLLIVGVNSRDSNVGGDAPSNVTYNSVAMTKVTDRTHASATHLCTSLWYLIAPATGTNNIVVSWGKTVDSVDAAGVSFNGAFQDSTVVVGAATTEGTSNAPSLNIASTNLGEIVIDSCSLGNGSVPTATVGANQTQRWNVAPTNMRGVGSTEAGNGGTITMSWSLSGSIAWVTAAVRILGNPVVGLDVVSHKTRMVSIKVSGDDHQVAHSSDGITWTAATTQPTAGLLDNNVTVYEDIDAGLLATVGNELVAVVWHESNGTITFFSSTNAGVAWSDEAVDIASANGPHGVAVMAGIDNADKLYVGTNEGLWEVDTSTSTWTIRLIDPLPSSDDNCRRMAVHNAALWYSVGVDDNSPVLVRRLVNREGIRIIESGWGLNVGDGVPSDLLGPIRWMKSSSDYLFVSVGGGDASRNARVLCHTQAVAPNGLGGWHSMRKNGTADQKIEWIDVSANDDGTPRLHYSVRTSTPVSNTKFLAQPLVNPSSGVTIKREATGILDLPEIDGGMPTIDAAWLQVRVDATGLASSTDNESINIAEGIEGTAHASLTNLGDIISTTSKLDITAADPGEGRSGTSALLRTTLSRGSTNTNTPVVRSVELDYIKQPGRIERWWLKINLALTADLLDSNTEAVITTLTTARNLSTLVAFNYGNQGNKFVKVKELRWGEDLDTASGEPVEAAPDATKRRTGNVLVRLEQIID